MEAMREEVNVGLLEILICFTRPNCRTHTTITAAPQRLEIQVEMLSDRLVKISRQFRGKRPANTYKLVPNLMAKKNYVGYYRNLRFYLHHGMTRAEVHRVKGFALIGGWSAKFSLRARRARFTKTRRGRISPR